MNSSIDIIKFANPVLDGLASTIGGLIGVCASIAAGIILFTVILKLITFPFDLYSKISMRKNSLKMEEMRPELEKLQEQYANDKVLYNQKLMALYKKNGYSMWGACLPTILTLVIFIVAISAFTDYSNYQNQKYFYDMSVSYNSVIYDGLEKDNDIIKISNGQLKIDGNKLIVYLDELDGYTEGQTVNYVKDGNSTNIEISRKKLESEGSYSISVKTEGGYTEYVREYTKFSDSQTIKLSNEYYYIYDTNLLNSENALYAEYSNFDFEKYVQPDKEKTDSKAVAFVKTKARTASAKKYRSEKTDFLWIENLFVADSMFEHPIQSDWNKFKSTYDYEGTQMTSIMYNELTYNLGAEKQEYNGYFGLVALTILTSIALQIITNKSQKAQMELQSVDGRGSATQKAMMWIMPIMMGIFAFFYTAAFSVYIIISSVISILTTVGTNLILNKKFKKVKEEKASKPIRGRVYVPKEQPKEEKQSKKYRRKEKKNKIADNDFLSGLADKKGKKKKKR